MIYRQNLNIDEHLEHLDCDEMEAVGQSPRFMLEPFEQISFNAGDEWLIDRVLPKRGLATLFSPPGGYKSFIVADIALRTAAGLHWAGRQVSQAPAIYVASEGAAGFRKRLAGVKNAFAEMLPNNLQFFLISSPPNLGTENGDLTTLVSDIQASGVSPGLIVLDTLSASLGSADENGVGMVQFVANAHALASRFQCLVLVVHHTGLKDATRMRGHSSLLGAADAVIHCERGNREFTVRLTLQKLKDEISDIHLEATLTRVVVGQDQNGRDDTTLVVSSIADAPPVAPKAKAKGPSISRPRRLFVECIKEAIQKEGELVSISSGGKKVKAAPEAAIRSIYTGKLPISADTDIDQKKARDAVRKRFERARDGLIEEGVLVAEQRDGQTYLYIHDADAGQTGSKDPRPCPSMLSSLSANGQDVTES